ncbi:hypothetical protein KP509_1Z096600 [Ceratopteris richardii]|nr:hypothetical protein KP509_1Z096600 [Ceratopteris richardii]
MIAHLSPPAFAGNQIKTTCRVNHTHYGSDSPQDPIVHGPFDEYFSPLADVSSCRHPLSESAIICAFLIALEADAPQCSEVPPSPISTEPHGSLHLHGSQVLSSTPIPTASPATQATSKANLRASVSHAIDAHCRTHEALFSKEIGPAHVSGPLEDCGEQTPTSQKSSRLSEPWSSPRMPLCGATVAQHLRTISPMDKFPFSLTAKASCDALAFSLCAADGPLLATSLDDFLAEDEAISATFLKALRPSDIGHIDPIPPKNQEGSALQTLPHSLGPQAIVISFTTQAFTPEILLVIEEQFRSFSASTPEGLPFFADTQASHKQKLTLPLTCATYAQPYPFRAEADAFNPSSKHTKTSNADVMTFRSQLLHQQFSKNIVPYSVRKDNPFRTFASPTNSDINIIRCCNQTLKPMQAQVCLVRLLHIRAPILSSLSTHWCPPTIVPCSTCTTFFLTATRIPPIKGLLEIPLFNEGDIPHSDKDQSPALTADAMAATNAAVIDDLLPAHLHDHQQWDLLATMLHHSLHALWCRNYLLSRVITLWILSYP